MSPDTVAGMLAVALAIVTVESVVQFAPFCAFWAASATFQLSPATSGATSGSILAAHSTILTAPLASRYASTHACIQDVCTVFRLIADVCLCRMNLAHMMLSRGHVALACCAGGHHGRRAERHQFGSVHRSLVRVMRMASGVCVDVQELARGRFAEQRERCDHGTV